MAKLIRSIRRVVAALLPWGAKRFVYRILARRYIKSLAFDIQADRRTILVINHFFGQDLRALELANRQFNLVPVAAQILFRGANIFFTEAVQDLRAPYAEEAQVHRTRYRRECEWILNCLEKRAKIDLILTPSDIFYWIRELIGAARERGVKTVVIDKEGTISPFAYKAVAERVRTMAPFMSDHLYVWSRRQREYWMSIGAAEEKITVVGQPRSDLFFLENGKQVDQFFPRSQPLVTYFSFDDIAYLPPELRDQGFSWRQLKQETLDDLASMAQDYPGFNFVIKAHPQQLDLAALTERFRRDNLVVIGGSQVANELILRSELVIGFQTTALIEAMFLDKRVIYTAWDKIYQEKLWDDLLPLHRAKGIVVAKTRGEFVNACRKLFQGDETSFKFSEAELAGRDRFVDDYLHQPDGKVCERILNSLDSFLSEEEV